MSRSGYSEDIDDMWEFIRWRGAVSSATNGRRGQDFLRALLAALDALPEKKLIAAELVASDGCVCALGALGKSRAIDMSGIDPEDIERVAAIFGIAGALAKEVVYMNDDAFWRQTPEERFTRMREWVVSQIKPGKTERSGFMAAREETA